VVGRIEDTLPVVGRIEDTLPVVGRIEAFIISLTGEGLTSAFTGNACVHLAGGDEVFGGRRIFWSGLAIGEGALTNPLNEVGTKFFSGVGAGTISLAGSFNTVRCSWLE